MQFSAESNVNFMINPGHKYMEIISKLFPPVTFKKRDGLVPSAMTLNDDRIIEYDYFDDPYEICEKLKLLMASKKAGNAAHENEIIPIVKQLKERSLKKGESEM